jgi:hypothetical protein
MCSILFKLAITSLQLFDQQIKALLENVGASMCPDQSDWFGNSGLDAQPKRTNKSVVLNFLQAHPTDYATKKLQVGSCISQLEWAWFMVLFQI